jgi:hypothetical protein
MVGIFVNCRWMEPVPLQKGIYIAPIFYQTCPIRDLTSHNMLIRTVTDCMFRSECTNILYIAMDPAVSNIFLTTPYGYVQY